MRLFRENKSLADQAVVNQKLFECQARHDIAWHYLIPYPRLHHQKPFKYREPPVVNFPARPGPPSGEGRRQ